MPNEDPAKKLRKIPHYVNGKPRNGKLDALRPRGPDGTGHRWQGLDFDDMAANGLAELASVVQREVEMTLTFANPAFAEAVTQRRSTLKIGLEITLYEPCTGGILISRGRVPCQRTTLCSMSP